MDIRVSAYGIIVRDAKILLAHWRQGALSGWTLPGGGLEPGEDPADAAVREIREETGYVASLDRLLAVDSIVGPSGGRSLQGLRIIYSATVVSGELAHEQDGSTDEAKWIDLDAVETLDRVELVNVGVRAWREQG